MGHPTRRLVKPWAQGQAETHSFEQTSDQTPGPMWPKQSDFICDLELLPYISSQVPSKHTLEKTYPLLQH